MSNSKIYYKRDHQSELVLLKQGTVLIDPNEQSDEVRVLFYLEHAIQDGRVRSDGNRHVISRQMQFVEINSDKTVSTPGYAPYLDYRPIDQDEKPAIEPVLQEEWLNADLESEVKDYAVEHLVTKHLDEVKAHRETLVQKTMRAVKERLTKEINYWDNRAYELGLREEAGNRMASLNAAQARQRADELETRLENGLIDSPSPLLWKQNGNSDVTRQRCPIRIQAMILSPRIRKPISCCSLKSKENLARRQLSLFPKRRFSPHLTNRTVSSSPSLK